MYGVKAVDVPSSHQTQLVGNEFYDGYVNYHIFLNITSTIIIK